LNADKVAVTSPPDSAVAVNKGSGTPLTDIEILSAFPFPNKGNRYGLSKSDPPLIFKQNSNDRQTISLYKEAVIDELKKKLNVNVDAAKQIFVKFNRPVRQTWGMELNVSDFAERIVHLDRLIKRGPVAGGVFIGDLIQKKPRTRQGVKIITHPRQGYKIKRFVRGL
jgi:hypothetical protein